MPDDTFGWDFVQGDNPAVRLHSAHVAGTIGAQGNSATGVTGVNWDLQLMSLPEPAAPKGSLEDADIVKAFAYACAEGARVVNGGFGGPGVSQAMYDVIVLPGCENTLFVFAAGNDGENNDSPPAVSLQLPPSRRLRGGSSNVLCVAATDDVDELTDFSNAASFRSTWPHLARTSSARGPRTRAIFAPDGFDDLSSRYSTRAGRPDVHDRRAALGADYRAEGLRYAQPDGFSVRQLRRRLGKTTIRRLPPFRPRPSPRLAVSASYDIGLDTELGFDPFLVLTGATRRPRLRAAGGALRAACSSRCPRIFR